MPSQNGPGVHRLCPAIVAHDLRIIKKIRKLLRRKSITKKVGAALLSSFSPPVPLSSRIFLSKQHRREPPHPLTTGPLSRIASPASVSRTLPLRPPLTGPLPLPPLRQARAGPSLSGKCEQARRQERRRAATARFDLLQVIWNSI